MGDELSLEKWRQKLATRLASLGDDRQQAILFARSISRQEPKSAVQVIKQILVANFLVRDRAARLAAGAAMLALAQEHWPGDHRTLVLQSAVRSGERLVSLYIGEVSSGLPEEENDQFPIPEYAADRPLTLGERRSIASQPNRRLLEMAMRDPHPMVTVKLLGNPKLTEDDVVFIATRRPVPSAVLVEVAMHPRYRTKNRVARALVNNAALPMGVALALLIRFDLRYIEQLAADHRLCQSIREASRLILELVLQNRRSEQGGER